MTLEEAIDEIMSGIESQLRTSLKESNRRPHFMEECKNGHFEIRYYGDDCPLCGAKQIIADNEFEIRRLEDELETQKENAVVGATAPNDNLTEDQSVCQQTIQ